MQIFQTIWTAMTTQNETVSAFIFFPMYYIDTFVNMLLFTTIFSVASSRKSKIIYMLSMGTIAFLTRTFMPDPYGTFINMIVIIFLIKFVLKVTWLKSLLSEFIVIVISSVLELFIFKFYQTVFNLSQQQILDIPLYRGICSVTIYLCVYLLYRLIRYFKFNIKLESMTRKNKILFVVNTLLGILAIGTQFYLIVFYSDKMPIYITITSILSILAYFVISFYSLLSTNKLDTTTRDLEEANYITKL